MAHGNAHPGNFSCPLCKIKSKPASRCACPLHTAASRPKAKAPNEAMPADEANSGKGRRYCPTCGQGIGGT